MTNDHLASFVDKYAIKEGADGICYIETLHKPRDGMTFDVYYHSPRTLAACLPPKAARRLSARFPDTFSIHQEAEDAIVLLFNHKKLDDLSCRLRLKRRRHGRRLSDDEREQLIKAGHRTRFVSGSQRRKAA